MARATGQGELFLVLVATLGGLWRLRGKLAEAGELLDGGIEAARLLGNTHALGLDPPWPLRRGAARGGRGARARRRAGELRPQPRISTRASTRPRQPWISPRALLESGQPERAVELLLGSAGGEELVLIAGSPRAHYLELLARCWLALDRPAEARRAADAAEAWASAVQLPMALAWADRAAAAVDLHAGDAAARSRAGARVGGRRRRGGRAGRGGAVAHARGPRARRKPASATVPSTELQRAAREFEACGALRYRDEAERELRKLGHRIHRRTRPGKTDGTGIESLTERELQVARLVVDRKTNPEIAAELFLSQKTVETHLRNIFRKARRLLTRRPSARSRACRPRRWRGLMTRY